VCGKSRTLERVDKWFKRKRRRTDGKQDWRSGAEISKKDGGGVLPEVWGEAWTERGASAEKRPGKKVGGENSRLFRRSGLNVRKRLKGKKKGEAKGGRHRTVIEANNFKGAGGGDIQFGT